MNSEVNTSQNHISNINSIEQKLDPKIVQENSQKNQKHVNQTKISAHAFYPLQSMKLPQNS